MDCPVCGADNPPDAANCHSCQLSTALFPAVREAAGSESGDSDYAKAIAEILAIVGPETAGPAREERSDALLTTQPRFPALSEARRGREAVVREPTLPSLPMLPGGSGIALVHQQVEELLRVGRQEGLDLADADARTMEALRTESMAGLDEVRRSLFVRVAGAVAEDLEVQTARRNELAPLIPTPVVDTELAGSRDAFTAGDLAGTVRGLRQAADGLSSLEERWATCQVLSAEADLMIETLRDLGRDPGPAAGPLTEGRRLAREGEADRAEHMLAGANRALWELLAPQLTHSLKGILTQLQSRASSGGDIAPEVHELRQLSALIRRHNFGAAVSAYRRLVRAVASTSAPAAA